MKGDNEAFFSAHTVRNSMRVSFEKERRFHQAADLPLGLTISRLSVSQGGEILQKRERNFLKRAEYLFGE